MSVVHVAIAVAAGACLWLAVRRRSRRPPAASPERPAGSLDDAVCARAAAANALAGAQDLADFVAARREGAGEVVLATLGE